MKRFVAVMLIAVAGIAIADEKRVATRLVEKDGIRLKVGGEDGNSVTVDGVSFSPVSRLFVVNPDWTHRYYGYNDDDRRVSDARTTGLSADAVGLTYRLQGGRSDTIEGTQTLEILPGRRLRVATDIRMTTDTSGIMEHRIASINEAWLTNTKWSAVMNDGLTTSGQTPRWAPGTEPKNSTLLSDFEKVTFESPRGPLTIETSGSQDIALLDYRRNQWAEGERFYWFGILGSELPHDEILSYEVIFTFPSQPSAEIAESAHDITAIIPIETSRTVVRVPPRTDQIIPTPKHVTWGDGTTWKGIDLSVFVGEDEPSYNDAMAVISKFQQRFKKLYGISLTAGKDRQQLIYIVSSTNKKPIDKPEGYKLSVAENQVRISDIITTHGLKNAFLTLEQLVRFDDNHNAGFRRAEVTDWPSMPFRGIHFFTGKNARDLQIKMVSDILAPLKINNLIYQIDYVKWDSLPQIHSELLGMEKADAKAVGDAAERQGIDVIPLVNTFGHSEWLLQRPSMRYLADDPNDPYAYDPSNPEVYEITSEIYREAIAMFNPTIMHIGHDEVSLDGFPKKPENKAVGATQLFINDTMHYYDFLKEQGIRTMMWGDMLLGPGEAPDATFAPTVQEAERRRGLLPKDIIIADWHYKSASVADYKSLAIFNAAGFDTIACTWSAPDNIVRFAKAAADQREETTRSLGLMQTTWAGYSFDKNSLLNSLEQYAAYVLAAEAAWTGGAVDSKDVPFDYQKEFLRRWNGESAAGRAKMGWHASLDEIANGRLSAKQFSLADDAFVNLETGVTELGKYGFELTEKDGRPGVVRMAGAWDASREAPKHLSMVFDGRHADRQSQETTKPINLADDPQGHPVKTSEIYLAMATPFAAPDGTLVGTFTVMLDDGSTDSIELRYGQNVMSIADGRQTLLAPIAWESAKAQPGQGGAVIHVLRWENPTPEKKVRSLELSSNETGPGLMVLGVSGT